MKHTPGPWAFDGECRIDAVDFRKPSGTKMEDGRPFMEGLIALPYSCYADEGYLIGSARANALLIAAAPELLEAAKASEEILAALVAEKNAREADRVQGGTTPVLWPIESRVLNSLRAAIAKATGV